jgi:hypothetical protein
MEEILKKYKNTRIDRSKYSYLILDEKTLVHFFRAELGGSKKIHTNDNSQEIDLQVLTNLLKGIDASEEEIKKHVDSITEKHEIEIDRELKGGDKGIHKID